MQSLVVMFAFFAVEYEYERNLMFSNSRFLVPRPSCNLRVKSNMVPEAHKLTCVMVRCLASLGATSALDMTRQLFAYSLYQTLFLLS